MFVLKRKRLVLQMVKIGPRLRHLPSQIFVNVLFLKNFFTLQQIARQKKRGIMMERSWWPPFAKFCKNHFQLFLIAQHAEKSIVSWWQIPPQCPAFVMAAIREILQKSFPAFFKHQAAEKSIVSRWKIPTQCPAWCARRKKAQCHDGKFAMATICEILQKLISTIF